MQVHRFIHIAASPIKPGPQAIETTRPKLELVEAVRNKYEYTRDDEGEIEFTERNLRLAAEHFGTFFGEINEHILEREDLIQQAIIALLAKKHLLILGPAGTAKSLISNLILKRLIDEKTGEPSLFSKLAYKDMRTAEVIGPNLIKEHIDPKTGAITKELERMIEQGLAPFEYAFIDEFLDAGSVLRGAFLTALNERVLREGGKEHRIGLQSLFAATNKTLEQLRAEFGDELDAIIDRFGCLYWTVEDSLRDGTDEQMLDKDLERALSGKDNNGGLQTEPLLFEEIRLMQRALTYLQEGMKKNKWPTQMTARFYKEYKKQLADRAESMGGGMAGKKGPSKLHSPRSKVAVNRYLPAVALLRLIEDPASPIAVRIDDFEKLQHVLMMKGPQPQDFAGSIDTLTSREDQAVLRRLEVENEAFADALRRTRPQFESVAQGNPPSDLAQLRQNVTAYFDTAKNSKKPDELNEAKIWLEGNLSELRDIQLQVPNGETLYAQATTAYVRILTRNIVSGDWDAVETFKRTAAPHIQQLEGSLFRGELPEAVEEFRTTVREAFTTDAKDKNTLADFITSLNNTGPLLDVLGSQTVGTLQDLVRTRALACVLDKNYAKTIAPDNLEEQLAALENGMQLQGTIAKEGIQGTIPYKEALQHYYKMLLQLNALLRVAKEQIAFALTDPQKRNELLKHVDRAMGSYRVALQEFNLATPVRSRFPEELLNTFIENHIAQQKDQSGPDVEIEATVLNGASTAQDDYVGIEWVKRSRESVEIDPENIREQFYAFILSNNELMLGIEAIAEEAANFKREIRDYFLGPNLWEEEQYAPLVRDQFLAQARYAILRNVDGKAQFPIAHKNGLAYTGFNIDHTVARQAFIRATNEFRDDEVIIVQFLGTIGIPATPHNIEQYKNILGGQDDETQTIDQEVESKVQTRVALEEITQELMKRAHSQLTKTKTSIEEKFADILNLVAAQEAEERKQSTSLPPLTAPISLAGLADRYREAFNPSEEATLSTQVRFNHITIPVHRVQTDLNQQALEELTKTLEALEVASVDALYRGETAKQLEAIFELFTTAGQIDEGEVKAATGPILGVKLFEAHRNQHDGTVKQLETIEKHAVAVASTNGVDGIKSLLQAAQTQLKPVLDNINLVQLEELADRYEIDQQIILELSENHIRQQAAVAERICKTVLDAFAAFLNTIDERNFLTKRDEVRDGNLIELLQTFLTGVCSQVTTNIPSGTPPQITAYETRAAQLDDEFRAKISPLL